MAGLSALVVLPAAWLTGCSLSGDMMSGMGSEVEAAPSHGQSSSQLPGPGDPETQANALVVTARQREYLDALRAAGVKPSSELSALNIGSYVCQAHAARQTDQEVWDFVAPLVRNDVTDADSGQGDPSVLPAGQIQTATADYIRIATDRLC